MDFCGVDVKNIDKLDMVPINRFTGTYSNLEILRNSLQGSRSFDEAIIVERVHRQSYNCWKSPQTKVLVRDVTLPNLFFIKDYYEDGADFSKSQHSPSNFGQHIPRST